MNAIGNGIMATQGSAIALSIHTGGFARNLRYIGGTIPTAARPGDEGHTFIFHPEKPGIIGIMVEVATHAASKHDPGTAQRRFVVPVIQVEDRKFAFDLESIYIPPEGKMYRYAGSVLQVYANGQSFTNRDQAGSDFVVQDINHLFGLLCGDMTADEVKVAATACQEEVSARAVLEILEPLLREASFAPSDVGPQERAQYFVRRFTELLNTCDEFREENDLLKAMATENDSRFHQLRGQVRQAREVLRYVIPALRSVEITDSDSGLVDDAMEVTRLLRVAKNFFRDILDAVAGSWFSFSRWRRIHHILKVAADYGLIAPGKE